MAEYYTIREVAKKLGLTEQKVYYEIDHGRLVCETIAGRKVIFEEAFKAFRKRMLQESMLITPAEYCRKHNMSRSKFDYRKEVGQIKTVKIGGKVFVLERSKA